MRPRSLDPGAATETAVSELLRKFAALTEEPAPAGGATVPATAGAVTDSFLIASTAHSRPAIVAVADFKTDADNDQVEINSALTADKPDGNPDSARSATVVLAAGRYKAQGAISLTEGSSLIGTGRGTVWSPSAAGLEFVVNDDSELGMMMFLSGGGG